MLVLCKSPPNSIFNQFQNTVLDEDDCDIMLSYSVFSKRGKIGVDSLKSCLYSVLTLIVHADTNENFDSLEVITSFFSPLRKLTKVVDQTIHWLKITYLIFLRRIIIYDLRAIRRRDSW